MSGFKLAWYKGFSPAQRWATAKLSKEAIKNGEIPQAEELGCQRCGQKEGKIMYHNNDYSHPTKYLEALCWRCHMILHSEHINPEACKAYWESVEHGKTWPPVFKHDFGILAREHGIVKKSKGDLE